MGCFVAEKNRGAGANRSSQGRSRGGSAGKAAGSARSSGGKTARGNSKSRRRIDPARELAFEVMREIAGGAYANLALGEKLASSELDRQDAAFVTELVSGTTRMQGTYDLIIAAAGGRELNTLQPALVDVLRLGTHQLLGMRVPSHAAVNSTVELAAIRVGERVAGITNAIIRKVAAQDFEAWIEQLGAGLDEIDLLSLRYAHPRWIVKAYAELLPSEELETALAANNEPAIPNLTIRPGLATRDELDGEPNRYSPWGASRAGNPAQLKAVREGRAGVQDEGSQLVCLTADRAPKNDGPWLDLCAGPGGKSALLRGLAGESDQFFVANEIHPHRARLVQSALRAYCESHQVIVSDGTEPAWLGETFALVMADVPCSGIGALRRRPEARWRHQAVIIDELVPLQKDLLGVAIDSVQLGGIVLYATCSPHEAETVEVVRTLADERVKILPASQFLPEVPDATRDEDFVQLWPHRHGTDAMFIAVLQKVQ